ncbi:hypothetical protein [Polyangium mundeleinium]|uniref:Uncharacterized protein n=1 Tax=Polyangium mundeleinium TaxID=2995306 RepID=A0ABT5EW29_9BACT|nr:hypothetical protein [Polyangium mundeleinium]MDC0746023.1 hypothetical protein [Polyangium mundeleinium]
MAAGGKESDPRSSLLARWRASGRRPSAPPPPPRIEVEAAPRSPPPPDAATLLAAIEAGAAGVVPPHVLAPFVKPIREALALPPEARDPKALALAFDRVEELLEAFFFAGQRMPAAGG